MIAECTWLITYNEPWFGKLKRSMMCYHRDSLIFLDFSNIPNLLTVLKFRKLIKQSKNWTLAKWKWNWYLVCCLINYLFVILGKIYFRSLVGAATSCKGEVYVETTSKYTYRPFDKDFGPLDLGCIYNFCKDIHAVLNVLI